MKKIPALFILFIFASTLLSMWFVTSSLSNAYAVGEPCDLVNPNSCPSNLSCKPQDNTPNSPLTCQTKGNGDSCNLVDPNSCPSNLSCKPQDNTPNSPLTCQTKGVGDSCNLANPNSCPSNLSCKPRDNTPDSPNICQPKGVGDTCGIRDCDKGLTCVDNGRDSSARCVLNYSLDRGARCDNNTFGRDGTNGEPQACKKEFICTSKETGLIKKEITNTCKLPDEVCKKEGGLCGGVTGDCCEGFVCNPQITAIRRCIADSGIDSPLTLPPSLEGPCAGPIEKDGKCNGFYTGLGDIKTEPGAFISSLFRILLAASGAIALLLIIRAGYKIMTSEGKPEAVQEGRERLIAAIVGLLFLIFSLVFLQVIGVDILKIPGITGGPTAPGTLDISANPVSYAQCRDVLRNGSSGRCVRSIQQIIGVDPADGNYDQKTEDAVRKYQTENGLFPDGVVGPCTLGSMGGYPVDEICKGPLDEPTLREFQTEKGLVVDGQFGSCTWEALIGKPIPENCKRK